MVTIIRDYLQPLDAKRLEAFKKYIELQEDFKKLNALWVLTSFKIEQERETWVIENQVDDFTKEELEEFNKIDFWSLKTVEEKDEVKKKFPWRMWVKQENLFTIAPYYIWHELSWRIVCLDCIDTESINLINARTEDRVVLYNQFIKD